MAKLTDKKKKVVEPKSKKITLKSVAKEIKSEVKPRLAVKKKSPSIEKKETNNKKLIVDKDISKQKETKKIDFKKSVVVSNSNQDFLSDFN